MRVTTITKTVLAVSAIGLCGYWLGDWMAEGVRANTESAHDVRAISDASALESLSTTIKQLENNQAQLLTQVQMLRDAVSTSIESRAIAKADVPVEEEHNPTIAVTRYSAIVDEGEVQRQVAETTRRRSVMIEKTFQQESSSAHGAPSVETQIQTTVKRVSQAMDSSVSRIECRETLCVVEMTFPSELELQQFSMILSGDLPWNSAGYYRVEETLPGGKVRAKLYQTREGHTLPSIDG